jgi:uracil-DNA glycosylase family 4
LTNFKTMEKKDILKYLGFYNDIGISLVCDSENNAIDKIVGDKTQKKRFSVEQDIKELERNFKNIENFNLKKTAMNFVPFQGVATSNTMVIDGMPNTDEDQTGQSFVGDKGDLFKKMLNAIDLKFEDIFIATAIPWRPPGNRYPTNKEIEICRPFILDLVKILKPKIVLCFGEISTNIILGTNESILKSRGKWHIINLNLNSGLVISPYVLPTLSVPYLLTRPDMKRHAWEDIKLLRDKIKEIH